MAVFVLANFCVWLSLLAPLIITLQVKITRLIPDRANQPGALSVMLILGSVLGLIANPLVGRLSDRTTSRFGRRRPWMVLCALVALVGGIVLAFSTTFAVAALGWCVVMIGVNGLMAVLIVLIPDQVPSGRRGTVSALVGVGNSAAAIIAAAMGAVLVSISLPLALIVPGVLALAGVSLAASLVRDRRLDPADRPPFRWSSVAGSFYVNPFQHRDFGWAWISRFTLSMGVAGIANYQLFFLRTQLGLSDVAATRLLPLGVAVLNVTGAIVTLACGPWSDRLGRRKVFVLAASVLSTIGLVLVIASFSVPIYLLAMAFVGAGQALYFAVDIPLVSELLPDQERDAAKDMGVFNLANLLPNLLAPAIAPLFLSAPFLSLTGSAGENYTVLFLSGVVFCVISAITVVRIKSVR